VRLWILTFMVCRLDVVDFFVSFGAQYFNQHRLVSSRSLLWHQCFYMGYCYNNGLFTAWNAQEACAEVGLGFIFFQNTNCSLILYKAMQSYVCLLYHFGFVCVCFMPWDVFYLNMSGPAGEAYNSASPVPLVERTRRERRKPEREGVGRGVEGEEGQGKGKGKGREVKVWTQLWHPAYVLLKLLQGIAKTTTLSPRMKCADLKQAMYEHLEWNNYTSMVKVKD